MSGGSSGVGPGRFKLSVLVVGIVCVSVCVSVCVCVDACVCVCVLRCVSLPAAIFRPVSKCRRTTIITRNYTCMCNYSVHKTCVLSYGDMGR